MRKLGFLSLSLLSLLILIPGCITVQAPLGQPLVIGTFSSSPSTINSGGTSILSWNVTGANSVSIDNGIGMVNAAGSMAVSPATSTVYTISATNSAGTVTRSATTTVNSASLPPVGMKPAIIGFSSNLNSDGTSILSWNVTGANSVSIDQGIGQVNAAGTRLVSTAAPTVYTLSATNYTGTVYKSVATMVNSTSSIGTPAVITDFSSNLNTDGTSTLSWNVTGANSVSIDQYIGVVSAVGTMIVSPAAPTVYTLSATWAKGNSTNDIGMVTRSVVARVGSGSDTPWVQ